MRCFMLLALALAHNALALAGEKVDKDQLEGIAESYLARRPAEPLPLGLGYDEALELQRRYLRFIMPELGKRVGYKAGLVTAASQQRYRTTQPVRGVLLSGMLLTNGASFTAAHATRPILEADMIVRVKDAGINQAKTIEDVARHLSEVIVFIEIADAPFATNAPLDAGALTASNVGARAGVLGQARRFEATPEFIAAFGKMQLVLRDAASGRELSRVGAEGILGHPLNAVVWLVQDLNRRGEKLKPGEVLSLGSPSPQVAPKPGEAYTLAYEGLPGGPIQASVNIR